MRLFHDKHEEIFALKNPRFQLRQNGGKHKLKFYFHKCHGIFELFSLIKRMRKFGVVIS